MKRNSQGDFKGQTQSRACWHTPGIPELGKLRQQDHESQAGLHGKILPQKIQIHEKLNKCKLRWESI